MTHRFRSIIRIPALAALTVVALAAPARADRCDDLAAQLKGQIDGLGVGKTAANSIYLAHPAAKSVRLGCASRNVSNELSATADGRKASPAFLELVASATAVIFTIPKADTLRGAKRCVGRIGLFRGDDIKTRYRRLDIRCIRGKNDLTITISREKDA
jgi:hypothetical protein